MSPAIQQKKPEGSFRESQSATTLGGQVWGALYVIPDADLRTLDSGEGGYSRTKLPVRTPDGDITRAWVYLASRPSNDPALRPYTWYKRFLVEGALEHCLPPEYILQLERIEAVQDPDQQRDREMRALACG
jgi:gamma-glutamylcyclotransferase